MSSEKLLARPEAITSNALKTPLTKLLKGKRIILASQSPRRKQIFEDILGWTPEVVPSTFPELLSHSEYADNLGSYAAATAQEKAIEVYTRLVEQSLQDSSDPPDLVIAADSVIVTCDPSSPQQQILEKPGTKLENERMLLELNGKMHECYTAIVIVFPVLQNPGYEVKSLLECTRVYFADNPEWLIKAYVESGEGLDRAGGYAIQQKGGLLVQRIEGDHGTVVGFPAHAFYKWLSQLHEDGELLPDS